MGIITAMNIRSVKSISANTIKKRRKNIRNVRRSIGSAIRTTGMAAPVWFFQEGPIV